MRKLYDEFRKKYPDAPAQRALQYARNQAQINAFGLGSAYDYDRPTELDISGIPDDCSIVLTVQPENYPELPWEWCEGFGTIKPMQRYAEYAGNGNVQVRSYGRENYYYNFAEALVKARENYATPKRGKAQIAELALQSVKGEMKFFEGYICDDWHYVAIHVQAFREGEEVWDQWTGMYESNYWHEGACDLIDQAKHELFATQYAGSTVGVL